MAAAAAGMITTTTTPQHHDHPEDHNHPEDPSSSPSPSPYPYMLSHYDFHHQLGEGSYGWVFKATDKRTHTPLAIKMLKHPSTSILDEPEVLALTRIPRHPNIIHLIDFVQESNTLFLLYEFMHSDLHNLIHNNPPLPEPEIRNFAFQLITALHHIHSAGYFHRDLKPANILLSAYTLKIADFGSARPLSTPPYTDYVTTRWYRAPEVLLNSHSYGAPVDMWAAGIITAEMFIGGPLFPGKSAAHQLDLIRDLLGDPDEYTWEEGLRLSHATNYKFSASWRAPRVSLTHLMPHASREAVKFIRDLLLWDPSWRLTAKEALAHPFLRPCATSTPPTSLLGQSFSFPIEIS